jgi:hypothetical protein
MSSPRPTYVIPKIIHVIWAGGSTIMEEEGLINVSNWAAKNPDFTIWLWIDKITAPQNIASQYSKRFHKLNSDIIVAQSESESQSTSPTHSNQITILLKDINEENFRDEYVSYEIDKIPPNFGSSSDLLRLSALKYGGLYIDCTDVLPNSNLPLRDCLLFQTEHNTHILAVDHCSQQHNPSVTKLSVFNMQSLPGVGNDSFISTTNNPLLQEFLKRAIQNYNESKNSLDQKLILAHESFNIRSLTISRTGPELIRNTIKDFLKDETQEKPEDNRLFVKASGHDILICPIQSQEARLVIPARSNTLYWLKSLKNENYFTEDTENLENLLLEKIKKISAFEIKHFNILRLDDHISDYISILSKYNPDITHENHDMICEQLIHQLLTEDLDANIYIQISGLYKATADYCYDNGYTCIYDLESDDLFLALRLQTNLLFAEEFILQIKTHINEHFKNNISENTNIDTQRKETVLKLLESDSIPGLNELLKLAETTNWNFTHLADHLAPRLPNYISKMTVGLNYLEHYLYNLDGVFNDLAKVEILKPVIETFIKYGEILNSIAQIGTEGLKSMAKVEFPIDRCQDLLSSYQKLKASMAESIQKIEDPDRLPGCKPG